VGPHHYRSKMIPLDARRARSKTRRLNVVEVKSSHAVYVSHPKRSLASSKKQQEVHW